MRQDETIIVEIQRHPIGLIAHLRVVWRLMLFGIHWASYGS